jgi:hypothetical protein
MPDDARQPGSTETYEIQGDIACPDCAYNLRGLIGPIVACPECGRRTDVPELATRQWTKPWYRAPGFDTLTWPAAWCLLGNVAFAVVAAFAGSSGEALVAVSLFSLAVWSGLMVRASRVLDNRLAAAGLAILLHILLVGYLIGVFGLIAATIGIFEAVLDDHTPGAISAGVGLLICALLLWGCRRIERYTAGVCIRQHLKRDPKS